MKRTVTIELGEFSLEALAGDGGSNSADVAAKLMRAIHTYLTDKDTGRTGWPYPDFLSGREAGEGRVLELPIDEDLWRSFGQEAGRQGVTVEQLVAHATFYFAAEKNAGRNAGDLEKDWS